MGLVEEGHLCTSDKMTVFFFILVTNNTYRVVAVSLFLTEHSLVLIISELLIIIIRKMGCYLNTLMFSACFLNHTQTFCIHFYH